MPKDSRFLIIGFFLFLLILVLGFTGVLIVSDFQQNFVESLVSSYGVSGRQNVHKIEYALRYGKPLDNFFGIEDILAEVRRDFPEITEVQVVYGDGRVLYNLDGKVEDVSLSDELQEKSSAFLSETDNDYLYSIHEGEYHIFLPIEDRDNIWQGNLQIIFPADVINNRVADFTGSLVTYLAILAFIGLCVIFFLISRYSFVKDSGEINRKKFLIVTMVLLGLIQVVFGGINYQLFRNGYLDIAHENAAVISNIIRNDIESVVEKGVPYENLYRLEDYLKDISERVPEIDFINLTSPDESFIYSTEDYEDRTSREAPDSGTIDSEMIFSHSLTEDVQDDNAELQMVLSEDFFDRKMHDILLDSLTMLVLSLILMIEIVIFMIILLQLQYEKKYLSKAKGSLIDSKAKRGLDIVVVRVLTMLTGMSIFMSASFIPLRMKELFESLLGLSEGLILGIPISAEMLFAALAALFAGRLIDQKGWRFVLFMGLCVFAVGLFLSFYAPSALIFILARAFTGAGYGFILLSIRGYVNERPTEKERTNGFSNYVSGLYAGFIIGVVVGAMLADRIGFANVFLASLLFCLVAFCFTLVFLRKSVSSVSREEERTPAVETENEQPAEGMGVLSFLGNFRVLGFFLLIMLPLTICSMFVDYYFPIFATGEGMSTSNVGRAFMLNGIAIAYMGPFMYKFFHERLGSRKSIFVSGLIIVGSLLLFYFFNNIVVAFMVVILMGISESFGLVAQNNYFVSLKETGTFGTGAALGYAENVRKLGQMMGPFVFGSVVAMGSLGIGLIGLASFVMIVLFMFSSGTGIGKGTPARGVSHDV